MQQLRNRLRKMENRKVKEDDAQTIWDFSKTSKEQLLKLKALLVEGNQVEAGKYTQQLIGEGFLSYRIVGAGESQ